MSTLNLAVMYLKGFSHFLITTIEFFCVEHTLSCFNFVHLYPTPRFHVIFKLSYFFCSQNKFNACLVGSLDSNFVLLCTSHDSALHNISF